MTRREQLQNARRLASRTADLCTMATDMDGTVDEKYYQQALLHAEALLDALKHAAAVNQPDEVV